MEWQDINSGPIDGTVVEVRNELTRGMKLRAKFAEYESPWGSRSMQWVLVRDFDQFMPMQPGTLVIPTEWRHVQ